MECVHVVDAMGQPCHERVGGSGPSTVGGPVVRVQVLDDVATTDGQVWPQSFDAGYLMFRKVASIINDDIPTTVLLTDGVEEMWVGLVADMDGNALLRQLAHTRFDVDAHDRTVTTEIFPPHLQRATMRDTDLEERRPFAAIRREVFLVDREVVDPLVDQSAIVLLEILSKTTLPTEPHAEQITDALRLDVAGEQGIEP